MPDSVGHGAVSRAKGPRPLGLRAFGSIVLAVLLNESVMGNLPWPKDYVYHLHELIP